MGRRIKRGDGTTTTKFIYDGMDVLADDNAGTLTKYLNGLGIDNKLRVQTGSTINYFLTDHLGSTNGLADSSGSITSSTSYDSFGNATNTSFPTRYQYTGREYDSFTGMYYYRARWYDTNLGRFISEDPIGFAGGDVNLFGYVGNNPQNFTDPSGLFPTGSDFADWLDEKFDTAQDFYGFDPIIGFSPIGEKQTFFGTLSGSVDMFRVGNGTAQAFCDCDENIYGRAAFFAMDVQRASALFVTLGGLGTKISSNCNKGLGTNPFKGKTPRQIDDMFNKKGYKMEGADPLNGRGNYINPKSKRGYHIDAKHGPPKGPHVGVHRRRGHRKNLDPRDYGL